MRDLAIAIDIGGTGTRTALVNSEGVIVERTSIRTEPQQGMDAGLRRIAAAVRQVMPDDGRRVCGIGIAAAGLVDVRRGVALSQSNLPGWQGAPLRQYFEDAFQLPTAIGNDANLAALAEQRYGAGKGASHLIYITISTGIGGGIISDGRIYSGADGFAGEVGHHTIDVHGPRCNCGNLGCLEVLASGTAMARDARSAIAAGRPSQILGLAGGDLAAISPVTIAKAAGMGDVLGHEIIDRAGTYIGFGLVNLIHLFNPRLFVIGGGVSNIGEPLFSAIRRTVAEHGIGPMSDGVRIVPAALGDDSGLLGAAALVLDRQA
jgi:glucokinase